MSAGMRTTRRVFLKTGLAAGTGLVLGFHLPWIPAEAAEGGTGASFAPNAWLSVGSDGLVTLTLDKAEMGQGATSALAMILADEMGVAWENVRLGAAPENPAGWSRRMSTGGSSSVRGSWERLRKAGAAAREMLIAAAAKTWGVAPYACRAERGAVLHPPSQRRLTFGELATTAATLPVPAEPPLKDVRDLRLVGQPLPRLDLPAKVDGSARFGLDVRVPGMKFASLLRAPSFGARVRAVRDARARAVPGVREVFTLEPAVVQPTPGSRPAPTAGAVAVVADSTWQALEGRRALEVEWDEGPHAALDGAAIRSAFVGLAARPGRVVRRVGDAEATLVAAHRRLEAVYEVPFLHHATMEPMNCVAHVRPDACEVWAPTQSQTLAQDVAAAITGFKKEAVRIHTTFLGGGFGRRLEADYVAEAVRVSKLAGAPVQIVWTREDDLRHGFYRPASYHLLNASIDALGRPTLWTHRIVGCSIASRYGPLENGIDEELISGATDLPYAFPNLLVEQTIAELPVPVGEWRSVGKSHNTFVTECFFDEVAAAAGRDPLELRRALLRDRPRHRRVLDVAAEKADWGSALPRGHGRGMAVAEAFDTFVAQIAEVSVDGEGAVRVHRVVCAVDCGQVVNPDTVQAQIEGGVVFGLSAALRGEITIERGGVKQASFQDYPLLRIDEMPAVEVDILPSGENPGGIGEAGVPPIAPAVVNAIFAASGKRVRRLPVGTVSLG